MHIMVHYNMLLFLISCSFKLKMRQPSSQQQVRFINSKLKMALIQTEVSTSLELSHGLCRSLYRNMQHFTAALVRNILYQKQQYISNFPSETLQLKQCISSKSFFLDRTRVLVCPYMAGLLYCVLPSDARLFHNHCRVSDPLSELDHFPVTCPLDVEKKSDSAQA